MPAIVTTDDRERGYRKKGRIGNNTMTVMMAIDRKQTGKEFVSTTITGMTVIERGIKEKKIQDQQNWDEIMKLAKFK